MMRSVLLICVVAAYKVHGFATTTGVVADGNHFRGFDSRIDRFFGPLKSIQWAYTSSTSFGTGPVLNITSPDIACQSNSQKPVLRAKIRAGANFTTQWTPYFSMHKGPILTYLGREEQENQSLSDIRFFKIHQDAYNRTTDFWASDKLIRDNGTWTVQIPSDIVPGRYVLRQELIALHVASLPVAATVPGLPTGPQSWPVCYNIEVLGNGTISPDRATTVTFPGAYKSVDPGFVANIYWGPRRYDPPGPPVYTGSYLAPSGDAPATPEDAGQVPSSQLQEYKGAQKLANVIYSWAGRMDARMAPGGGGIHWDADNLLNAASWSVSWPMRLDLGYLLLGGLSEQPGLLLKDLLEAFVSQKQ